MATPFFTLLILLLLLTTPSYSSDPNPLQDICVADLMAHPSINGFPCKPAKELTSDDFFFDGLSKEATQVKFRGKCHPRKREIEHSRNLHEPGGPEPRHSHPRATESGVVIKGKLLVGLISTNNGFYSKVLGRGEMFVVPRGLVHFQRNFGKGKVLLFTAFNSHLPGGVIIPNTVCRNSNTYY